MKNIVILVSGRGSNMEAIVRACAAEGWGGKVQAAVLSNRADAAGLASRGRGIAAEVGEHRAFRTRDATLTPRLPSRSSATAPTSSARRLHAHPGRGVRAPPFDSRLVNIHPSLLPAFPGLHTHRRAIDAGCKASGRRSTSSPPTRSRADHRPGRSSRCSPTTARMPRRARPRPGARSIRARSAGWSKARSSGAAAASSCDARRGATV